MTMSSSTPRTIHDILTPALVLEMNAAEFNLATMASILEESNSHLRAHVKNHKSPGLARLQIASGSQGVTCATVREAAAMIKEGITDILIANEVVGGPKIARLVELLRQGGQICIAIDDEANAHDISKAVVNSGMQVSAVVDLEIGMGRCGTACDKAIDLALLIDRLPGLQFVGIMAYEGHVGLIDDPDKREAECRRALGEAVETKRLIEAAGLEVPVLTTSSTKSVFTASRIPEVTEIQAGMYLFGDTDYDERLHIPFKPAAFVLSTVISRSADSAVADAGIKAVTGVNGMPKIRDRIDCHVVGLNAEHTRIELHTPNSDLAPGDLLWLFPSYGDLVASLHREIYGVRGESVEHVWPVTG
jgi:3-hydroxy-D-aspartate aldolase